MHRIIAITFLLFVGVGCRPSLLSLWTQPEVREGSSLDLVVRYVTHNVMPPSGMFGIAFGLGLQGVAIQLPAGIDFESVEAEHFAAAVRNPILEAQFTPEPGHTVRVYQTPTILAPEDLLFMPVASHAIISLRCDASPGTYTVKTILIGTDPALPSSMIALGPNDAVPTSPLGTYNFSSVPSNHTTTFEIIAKDSPSPGFWTQRGVPGASSYVTSGDLDGDGTIEIIGVQDDEGDQVTPDLNVMIRAYDASAGGWVEHATGAAIPLNRSPEIRFADIDPNGALSGPIVLIPAILMAGSSSTASTSGIYKFANLWPIGPTPLPTPAVPAAIPGGILSDDALHPTIFERRDFIGTTGVGTTGPAAQDTWAVRFSGNGSAPRYLVETNTPNGPLTDESALFGPSTLMRFAASGPVDIQGTGRNTLVLAGNGFLNGANPPASRSELTLRNYAVNSTTTIDSSFVVEIRGEGQARKTVDLDNDGFEDLIVHTRDEISNENVLVLLQSAPTPSGVRSLSPLAELDSWGGQSITRFLDWAVVDLNGDGLKDINALLFAGFPPITPVNAAWLQTSAGTFVESPYFALPLAPPVPFLPETHQSVIKQADFDGDGHEEILVGRRRRALKLFRPRTSSLGALADGTVGASLGSPELLLTVNGSAGTTIDRVVEVAPTTPIIVSVAEPTTQLASAPTRFAVWGKLGVIEDADIMTVPVGTFTIPIAPFIQDPHYFTLADSFFSPNGLVPATPAPWTVTVPAGISAPVDLALTGVIEDASSTSGYSVMNTLRIAVR